MKFEDTFSHEESTGMWVQQDDSLGKDAHGQAQQPESDLLT